MKTTGYDTTGAGLLSGAWRKHLLTLAGGAVLVAGMTSCGTSGSVRPSSGAAMLDAVSKRDAQTRVKGSRVIAVNGAGSVGRTAHLASGLSTVTVGYDWPQGGRQEVDLRFRARPDRKYFIKYAAFPPSVNKLSGTTTMSTTAEGIAGRGWEVAAAGEHLGPMAPLAAMAGLGVMSPGIALGTVDYFSRVGSDIADKRKAAHWVDMMVVSENPAEGVVRFVRVYPNGQVIWKPWDGCSNAPGQAQAGRVSGAPAAGSATAGNGSSGTTFHRRGMED